MENVHKLKFATFFPGCLNVHLVKDVGMLPYVMHRDFGYESYIICYKNEDYPFLQTEVPGLKMLFIERKASFLDQMAERIKEVPILSTKLVFLSVLIDSLNIIRKNGKNFDVFQLYHLKPESILTGLIYRAINRRGILHLKLDMSPDIISFFRGNPEKLKVHFSLRYFLFKLASFDIISAETREVCSFMQDEFPFFKGYKKKIYYIPNGIDMQRIAPLVPSSSIKENNILHVARLGFHAKASDLVLTIFKRVFEEFPEWRLVLIGPMMDDFKKLFLDFMAENSPIGNKISYLGFIGEPRERLYEQYGKAKILLIPSRSESFGIAAVEAGAFGGVILGTDLPSIREITKDGSYGYLCPIDNVDCFTRKLRYMIKEEAELNEKSRLISDFVRINFDWSKICYDINRLIQEQLERRRSSNDNV